MAIGQGNTPDSLRIYIPVRHLIFDFWHRRKELTTKQINTLKVGIKLCKKWPREVTWCMEIKTIDIPRTKFMVKVWPNSAAEAMPVKMVATVDEYFFRIVSAITIEALIRLLVSCASSWMRPLRTPGQSKVSPAYLKKKEERMPCAALLHIKNIVAFEWPWRMSKLSGPGKKWTHKQEGE